MAWYNFPRLELKDALSGLVYLKTKKWVSISRGMWMYTMSNISLNVFLSFLLSHLSQKVMTVLFSHDFLVLWS